MRGSAGSAVPTSAVSTSAVSTRRITSGLRTHGSRTALLAQGSALSYTDLSDIVDSVVERLGPTRQLIQVSGGNDLETLAAYLGAIEGGHAVILTGRDPEHRQAMEDRYQPDTLLSASDGDLTFTRRDGEFQHELHPDLALVLSTSGSTGSAKSVRLSHANLIANAASIAEYLKLDHSEVAITSLPLHYCYGLSVLHSHLLVGATLVLSENSVLDHCFWNAVRTHSVTSFAGVPHTFDLLDRVGFTEMSMPSLRYVTQAGGRMAPEKVQRYAAAGRDAGWRLVVMYGQTEATARMAYLPADLALEHPDAIGIPIPGGSMRLVPTGQSDADQGDPVRKAGGHGTTGVCRHGTTGVGELIYSGANVMMGYAQTPEDLAVGNTLEELRTGDLATLGDDGLYRIVGRASRFAKLFGLRVDLDQVEAVLAELGVEGVCVEGANALVIAALGPSPQQVQRTLAERLSLPLSSICVVEVDEIPRLTTGKPDYRAVADLQPGDPVDPPTGSPPSSDSRAVAALFTRTLGVATPAGSDTFVSLGGDSLSYVETSVGLESLLGQLPHDWHTTPLSELESLVGAPRGHGRLDTTVALRALAIVLIVGSHAALFRFRGGAHVLLAVAGFNFARFQLSGASTSPLAIRSLRSASRIAIPAVAWLGTLAVVTTEYGWQSVALLNSYLGPREWTAAWRYWFIEALVIALVVCTAILSIPRIRQVESAHRVGFAWALLGVSLVFRFDFLTLGGTVEPLLAPHRVLWFFVLGWLIQRLTTTPGRALASLVALLAVPGFFGEPTRDAIVVTGIMLLIWVPSIRVPRTAARVAGMLAAASLYIYLCHYQVYMPLLERGVAPLWTVLAALLAGVLLWYAVAVVPPRITSLWTLWAPRITSAADEATARILRTIIR